MDAAIKSYRDLEVWKQAMLLAKDIYEATGNFPSEERFSLVSQMRRAVVSIPSNIAEGHARGSTAEFKRFVSIAMGSVAELETQLVLSKAMSYLSAESEAKLMGQCDPVGKMLRGLYRSLSNKLASPQPLVSRP